MNNHNDDDGDLGSKLFAAAEDPRRAYEVLSILKRNPDLVRIADPIGDTVLHVATRVGNVETVKKVVAFLDNYGYSKLLQKMLRDKNGDGDIALWFGTFPPLKGGGSFTSGLEIAVARQELMKGVPIKVAERWNRLYVAIKEGRANPDVMKTWLKENGKELLWHRSELTRETLLDAVVNNESKCIEPVEQLVKFMVTNSLTDAALLRNKDGNTALHLALQLGYFEKASILVKAIPGAVYQMNFKGVSPLYLAIKLGYDFLVKDMFEVMRQSSDPTLARKLLSMPNNKSATLVHCAIKHGCIETLQTVVAYLPELMNETDRKGWRPLSYAANQGYLDETIFFLVNFPKYATKFDRDGTLPIHKAVAGGHVSIIQTFLKHCPEALWHVDRKGRSVLHIAARYGKDDVLDYITRNFNIGKLFLNIRDREGKTAKDYAERSRMPLKIIRSIQML